MSTYDFSTLSYTDFEELSRDLLQAHLNVHLESFRNGRDKGIDLRYSQPKDQVLTIVQAKHYARSGFPKLRDVLRDKEVPKINRLRPTRYIVTTSCSLTPHEKDQLHNILTPYCHSTGDIFGKEDLNNLITQNPKIERQHFKLWLPSTAVLTRLLHNDVFQRSALELESIKKTISLFVRTNAFQRGLTLLKNTGACLLTGIPGIGKTITAQLLIAHHSYDGWEGIYLGDDANNAFKAYDPAAQQIFFYDDFLGATQLREPLRKNEDKDLIKLLRTCRDNHSHKRIVLTTRDHLFADALTHYEILSAGDALIRVNEVVRLEDYTRPIRAQILVNHLYFNGIDPATCTSFVQSGKARKTIEHPHYNPRIVETACLLYKDAPTKGGDFGTKFIEMLDSPERIWHSAFHQQLSSGSQRLLRFFAAYSTRVPVELLKTHFREYLLSTNTINESFETQFHTSMKDLVGTFLVFHNKSLLGYHNPSIEDFMKKELQRESIFLTNLLRGSSFGPIVIAAARLIIPHMYDTLAQSEVDQAVLRTLARARKADWLPENLRLRNRSEYLLLEWIKVLVKVNSSDAVANTLVEIEHFFHQPDLTNTDVDIALQLIDAYGDACNMVGIPRNLDPEVTRRRLLPACVTPDDFELITGGNELEAEKSEELREHFRTRCWNWLVDEVESATSSDDASSALEAFKETARSIDRETEYDYRSLEATIDRLMQEEDAQADMREEERQFQEYDFRAETREVDDILDSMSE